MGPNHSFFRFVKYMMRDSLKVSYIEHLLSSSSLLKNKGVLIHHGGGKFEKSTPMCLCLFLEEIHRVIFEPCTCNCFFVIHLSDPFPLSHSILMSVYPLMIGFFPSHHLRMLCPSQHQCCQVNFFCRAYQFEDSLPRVYHSQSYTPSSTNCTCVIHALLISRYLLIHVSCH